MELNLQHVFGNSGFGLAANYTYVEPSTFPNAVTEPRYVGLELPLQQLSKHTYNFSVFYERDRLSARLAYNWRSEYLLSIGPNGYNGTNNNLDGESIAWKLPVYSDSFGQLDGSIFYRFSDNVQIGLEMNNLNNAEQRTLMDQNGAGKRTTSWYVNDRRYAATLRFTF